MALVRDVSPVGVRTLGPRDPAGAAAAGTQYLENPEPRAGEERAQPGWGVAAGANFSHRGSREERRGDPGPGMAAWGSLLAGCRGQSLRTPTLAKSGSGEDGPRLRGQAATAGEEQGATTRSGAGVSRRYPDVAACGAHAQSRSGKRYRLAPCSPQLSGMGCGHTGCTAAAKTPTH